MLDTLLAGILQGNAYALVAVGLTLIFGVSNVVNFAQGSVYAIGTMTGWWLIADEHWSIWAALVGVTVIAGLLGLFINIFTVQPLSKVPHIAALLATYGVSVILDNASQAIFGPDIREFPQVLSTTNFHIGSFLFGTLDILMLAVAVGAMLLLVVVLKFTKYGRGIRATAQDFEAAQQMGIPVRRIQHISFVVASGLGGLAGVLVGMYQGNITPTDGATATLTAFTAATLGGLASLPGAVVGGIGLGIVEAFGIYWWGGGVDDLIIFGLLLIVLWVRPGGLFGRPPLISSEPLTGTFLGLGRPIQFKRWQVALLVAVAVAVVPFAADNYELTTGTQILVYAVLGLSLTLVSGSAGQISLGQVGPLGVGAYTLALLTTEAHWSFLAALPLSGITAALFSAILMSPTWRLRGHYVSIASLGVGLVTIALILNWTWLTHGALGISAIPPPELFGYQVVTPRGTYLIDLAVLLIVIALVVRIQKSHLGTIFQAVGSDEVALGSVGVRPGDYKALAYTVGSFIAGIAGALLAAQYSYIDPTLFTTDIALLALTIVILGGTRSTFGAVLGAVVLLGGPEVLRMADNWREISYGLLLVLLIRFRPRGLWARAAV
jgi:branched-chain amino acid transport system permease protein